jgi:hypothetical protein
MSRRSACRDHENQSGKGSGFTQCAMPQERTPNSAGRGQAGGSRAGAVSEVRREVPAWGISSGRRKSGWRCVSGLQPEKEKTRNYYTGFVPRFSCHFYRFCTKLTGVGPLYSGVNYHNFFFGNPHRPQPARASSFEPFTQPFLASKRKKWALFGKVQSFS